LRNVTALVVCLAAAGCGASGASRVDPGAPPRGEISLAQVREFDDFPLLYAGEHVDGLQLVAILRRDDSAEYVSFVYGDCEPADEQGCAPPAEVQVWPACARSLDRCGSSPDGPTAERTVVRGVPAVALDGGSQLELQSGRSTVVVFAETPARAARVARALRPVRAGSVAGPLAPPADGPC
jgi:hypothetical protein